MNIILIFCVTSVIPNTLNGPNGTKVHAEQNTNGTKVDAEQNTNGTKVHAEQNTNGTKEHAKQNTNGTKVHAEQNTNGTKVHAEQNTNEEITLMKSRTSRSPSNTEILIEPHQERNENVNFEQSVKDLLEVENYSSSSGQILEHKGLHNIDQFGVHDEDLNIDIKEDLKGVNHENVDVHSEGEGSINIKDEVSKKVKSEGSEGAKDKGSEVSKDKNLDKSENKNEDEIIDENTNKTKEEDSYRFTGEEETNSEAINEDLDENEKDKTPERIAEDKAKDSVDAEYD